MVLFFQLQANLFVFFCFVFDLVSAFVFSGNRFCLSFLFFYSFSPFLPAFCVRACAALSTANELALGTHTGEARRRNCFEGLSFVQLSVFTKRIANAIVSFDVWTSVCMCTPTNVVDRSATHVSGSFLICFFFFLPCTLFLSAGSETPRAAHKIASCCLVCT